jgi:hypothetical protein
MNKLSYEGFNNVSGDINTAKEFLMKKRFNLLIMLVCLLAFGLVLVGCGDDDSGDPSSPPSGNPPGGGSGRQDVNFPDELQGTWEGTYSTTGGFDWDVTLTFEGAKLTRTNARSDGSSSPNAGESIYLGRRIETGKIFFISKALIDSDIGYDVERLDDEATYSVDTTKNPVELDFDCRILFSNSEPRITLLKQ